MHPKTVRILKRDEFEQLKNTIALRSKARKALTDNPHYAAATPADVSLQLTYRCNLRCKHCYQWNDKGFFHDMDHQQQKTELPLPVIEKVLRATQTPDAKLFLWGGEPLIHSQFNEISTLLQRYPRTIIMCTNGILIKKRLDDLLALGNHLNLLVSLDGLEEQHDQLRGKGKFRQTSENIQYLLRLKQEGRFRGEVSLSCMVSESGVGKMYEFMTWAEQLGVNTVYFQYPWFISPEVAGHMDSYFRDKFCWMNPPSEKPTWHAYTYQLPESQVPVLRESLAKLASRPWHCRIRYQPQLEEDEIDDFIRGTSRPAQHRQQCLALSNRLEVHANGDVTSCKFFSEFVIGNLHDQQVDDIWHGPEFQRIRETLNDTGLMPVCSKCILLYLNGV
ncbi:radical SAM protein [Lonsdalea populi]|uniref:Radical SAM protein n=1 Tax=Lonsdalea populi TaxID=1172565 RepID=A0A3N0UC58_9GAMM|nr:MULTISPECIES: radical SAM protein [Lonsdalea]OSM94520.1 radical SAM protein [Lonsdalea populi]OSN01771.1 radical SAM protein [Lonsdalea populi]QPQ25345.1 SPASM domain-containing protein [Lonsdalea populi]RAT14616.1 radical SAM protein [Lonsdalea quercina]RAT28401.1 radical SAM protein [Lonsdalea populi]